ncbi:hypothetical protein Ancab_000792 [Ancistrocladus abbreviatus]
MAVVMGGLGQEQENGTDNRLDEFIESGIYKLKGGSGSNAVFLDPVRILNRHYIRFRVSSSSYYTRIFQQAENEGGGEEEIEGVSTETTRKRKRKRKKKKKEPHILNDKEEVANRRHQEARSLLVKAHQALLEDSDVLEVIRNDLRTENCESECRRLNATGASAECSFIELGKIWQAPFYEIKLQFDKTQDSATEGDSVLGQDDDDYDKQEVVPIFNNLVMNETESEVEAEFLGGQYILPRRSCFYMSHFGQIHNLIPGDSDSGFNLIVIDPPWENRSAHQKSKYPTLPNRYFLALSIKQLTLRGGALVALWVTNREKLRSFVENELFHAWGVRYVTTFYWLKVKADGSLVCDLDLFHHRPYECLLLGYSCCGEVIDSEHSPPSIAKLLKEKENRVIISIPGDYSRKPPVGELLLEYVPGPRPARCIELFAREMMAGWTSWGNEPLHFQESRYFLKWNG